MDNSEIITFLKGAITFFRDDLTQYPIVQPYGTEAFKYEDGANCFLWRVHSTTSFQERTDSFKLWTSDFLTFAFYFPKSHGGEEQSFDLEAQLFKYEARTPFRDFTIEKNLKEKIHLSKMRHIADFSSSGMPVEHVFKAHSGDAVLTTNDKRKWIDNFDCLSKGNYKCHYLTCESLIHLTKDHAVKLTHRDKADWFWFSPNQSVRFDDFNLVWWDAYPPEDWKKTPNEDVQHPRQTYQESIGHSPPFDGESGCGPKGFIVSWRNILEAYAASRDQEADDVEIRIFGTFRYKTEIRYAVLVCITR